VNQSTRHSLFCRHFLSYDAPKRAHETGDPLASIASTLSSRIKETRTGRRVDHPVQKQQGSRDPAADPDDIRGS
jgi:hypothetical protein